MSIEVLKRAPDELVQAAKRTKQELQKVPDNLPPRTSDLAAPIMHLTGHAAEASLYYTFHYLNSVKLPFKYLILTKSFLMQLANVNILYVMQKLPYKLYAYSQNALYVYTASYT